MPNWLGQSQAAPLSASFRPLAFDPAQIPGQNHEIFRVRPKGRTALCGGAPSPDRPIQDGPDPLDLLRGKPELASMPQGGQAAHPDRRRANLLPVLSTRQSGFLFLLYGRQIGEDRAVGAMIPGAFLYQMRQRCMHRAQFFQLLVNPLQMLLRYGFDI
jgi:hypothetical protein